MQHAGARSIPSSFEEPDWLRKGVLSAYPVLREREWPRQRQLIIAGITDLLEASVVRAYEPDGQDSLRLSPADAATTLPRAARQMEQALLPRALAAQRSLLSTHPLLDADLRSLANRCRRQGIVTQILLVRAHRETHGAFAVHWIGHDRPPSERRVGFYAYWDEIGLAVAMAHERARIEGQLADLRERVFRDPMTGLPNGRALDAELQRHALTKPFSALFLDFDGMREANNAFKSYKLGGDVLIRAVGRELAELAHGDEYAARQHDTGDEFVLLLPGVDEPAAAARARQVEAHLDAVRFEHPAYQRVYHGASVGYATRQAGETAGQVLGRATAAMHQRKAERRASRAGS